MEYRNQTEKCIGDNCLHYRSCSRFSSIPKDHGASYPGTASSVAVKVDAVMTWVTEDNKTKKNKLLSEPELLLK